MFEIVLSATAQNDLRANVQWWSEHRSPSEAERWYVSILESIYSLEHMPTRCLLAREAETLGIELHNLWFGLSAKQTHRVLYTAPGDTHKPEVILPSLTRLVFEHLLPSLTSWLSPNCRPKLSQGTSV